jgi:hypothetical protein
MMVYLLVVPGIVDILSIFLLILGFILQLAILAFLIAKIYKTEVSLLKAFLVILIQLLISFVISAIISFLVGPTTGILSMLLFRLR